MNCVIPEIVITAPPPSPVLNGQMEDDLEFEQICVAMDNLRQNGLSKSTILKRVMKQFLREVFTYMTRKESSSPLMYNYFGWRYDVDECSGVIPIFVQKALDGKLAFYSNLEEPLLSLAMLFTEIVENDLLVALYEYMAGTNSNHFLKTGQSLYDAWIFGLPIEKVLAGFDQYSIEIVALEDSPDVRADVFSPHIVLPFL